MKLRQVVLRGRRIAALRLVRRVKVRVRPVMDEPMELKPEVVDLATGRLLAEADGSPEESG